MLGCQNELERRWRSWPPCEEEGYGLVAQTACREGQDGHRQRIEPWQVVDGHHERLTRSHRTQDVQEREGDGVRARSRASHGLGSEQCYFQRRSLWSGQAGQDFGPDPVAQIDQAGKCHPGFGPGRASGQHEPTRSASHRQAGVP